MKEIKLTQGYTTIVDDFDYDRLSQYNWSVHKSHDLRYAIRTGPDNEQIFMHREIMRCPIGKQVDHINHDGLDNRWRNLRICTASQNLQNARKFHGTKYRFKGVCAVPAKNGTFKWEAWITYDRKRHYLGRYKTDYEAAQVYNRAATMHFGEFASLNILSELEEFDLRYAFPTLHPQLKLWRKQIIRRMQKQDLMFKRHATTKS